MTKRRQNVLVNSENSSSAKQQLSFDELLHSFILDCKAKNLSPLTLRAYQDCIQQMKEAFEEQNVPLNIYKLTSRADNTVNSRIKGMKQFLRYLFIEGWITKNIAEEIHVVKAVKLMIQTFTKEQVAALLEQPNRKTFTGIRDYTMMVMLFETGMRISELCRLKLGDLFFKEQEI